MIISGGNKMSDEEGERREEKNKNKVDIKLTKIQLALIFVVLIVLITGTIGLLLRNFNIVGQFYDGKEYNNGDGNGVFVSGSYAYVAKGWDGLAIIDISDPTAPVEVGQFQWGWEANGVYVSESYAYVADIYEGLLIIDISEPTTPAKVGQFDDDSGFAYDVYVLGSYAYVADWSDGLEIIDISDPTAPMKVGQFYDGGLANSVYVSGLYAYVADGDDGLEIVDISDPTTPVEVGQFNDGSGSAKSVYVSGSYAYVAEGGAGLSILDISDPTIPVKVGQFNDDGYARDVFVSGSYAYMVDEDDGLKIIDISDPTTPVKVEQFNRIFKSTPIGVYVSGSYAYLVYSDGGLEIIELWSLKETISNVILWSIIGILIFLVVVDLRYLIWNEEREKKKATDFFNIFLLIYGLLAIFLIIILNFGFENFTYGGNIWQEDIYLYQIVSILSLIPFGILLSVMSFKNREKKKIFDFFKGFLMTCCILIFFNMIWLFIFYLDPFNLYLELFNLIFTFLLGIPIIIISVLAQKKNQYVSMGMIAAIFGPVFLIIKINEEKVVVPDTEQPEEMASHLLIGFFLSIGLLIIYSPLLGHVFLASRVENIGKVALAGIMVYGMFINILIGLRKFFLKKKLRNISIGLVPVLLIMILPLGLYFIIGMSISVESLVYDYFTPYFIALIINIPIMVYVYMNAKKRDMGGIKWGIIVFFTLFSGFILYLGVKEDHPRK